MVTSLVFFAILVQWWEMKLCTQYITQMIYWEFNFSGFACYTYNSLMLHAVLIVTMLKTVCRQFRLYMYTYSSDCAHCACFFYINIYTLIFSGISSTLNSFWNIGTNYTNTLVYTVYLKSLWKYTTNCKCKIMSPVGGHNKNNPDFISDITPLCRFKL